MKQTKPFLLAILIAFVGLPSVNVFADGTDWLIFSTGQNGTVAKSILFQNQGRLYFDSDAMRYEDSKGSVSIPYSASYMYFNSTSINTLSYYPGDVNNDGEYSVPDVNMAIDFLLGNTPANAIREAADVNEDGEITVPDVSIIISYIMEDRKIPNSTSGMSKVARKPTYTETLISRSGNDGFSLSLTNIEKYIGLQFEINLPENVELVDAAMADVNCGYQVVYKKVSENVVKVLVYSLTNVNFNPESSIKLQLESSGGSGEIQVKDVLIVEKNGNLFNKLYAKGASISNETSGIEEVLSKSTPSGDQIYNINGQKVNRTNRPGIYIINNKKVLIK